MKKTLVSSVALMAIAASTMVASAASSATSVGATYDQEITWPTGPTLITVDNGFPLLSLSTTTNLEIEADLSTDGAGKIEGVAFVRILHGGATSNVTEEVVTNGGVVSTNFTTNVSSGTGFSDFIVDVNGKISSKKDATSVTLSLKGSGYSSSNAAPDFFTVESGARAASIALTFSGSGAVSNDTVAGTVKGTINPGLKGINGGKSIKINEAASLAVSDFGLSNMFMEIVQIGTKFSAAGFLGEEGSGVFSGKGSVNSSKSTFTSSFKGVGQARGANFKLTGTSGPFNIGFGDVTNNAPNAPVSGIELKGKVLGQTVDVTGGTANIAD